MIHLVTCKINGKKIVKVYLNEVLLQTFSSFGEAWRHRCALLGLNLNKINKEKK